MADSGTRCPGCRRPSCDGCGLYQERKKDGGAADEKKKLQALHTNKQVNLRFPKGFEIEKGEGLGLSVDVGTTTLAVMLWDLRDGRLLDAETASNPQAVFGADVVSRVQAAEDEKKRKEMQRLLVRQIDEAALHMIKGIQEKNENGTELAVNNMTVKKITIVGNTAMCEILLDIKPQGMLCAPFIPDYEGVVYRQGSELGLMHLGKAGVAVLPPIGGFVGADALAVAGYVGRQEKEAAVLAVDIGTNGEILLQWKGRRLACSAAAGPALEGGAISQGMRAAEGAIDMVCTGGRFPVQDVVCRVIGGAKPKGICGSGLVDALAVLYREGILDQSGYMRSLREAKACRAPERLCRRIREENGERRFLLTDEKNPVYLKAEDVRQLQLSVSAIRSGMEILLRRAGARAEQLDGIYLAGAFGSYIGIESGIAIGLFPDVPKGRLIQAGNLAGAGAAMALLSSRTLREMERESRDFEHVELAREEEFEGLFLTHMNFPEKNFRREI
ncbi:MAG: ATP-binding protein [Lachnospiraceae bacterium]|nr:ATP-binding protein [Lachnospiraceae bacterium]